MNYWNGDLFHNYNTPKAALAGQHFKGSSAKGAMLLIPFIYLFVYLSVCAITSKLLESIFMKHYASRDE